MSKVNWLIQNIFAYGVLSISCLVVAILFYLQFVQNYNILSDLNNSVTVNNGTGNTVLAGGLMILDRSFCINSNEYEGTVTRSFTNHVIYQLPDTGTSTSDRRIGCNEKQYVVEIPSALHSGIYEYKVRISYQINPLKTVNYYLTTVPIVVENKVWDKVKQIIKEDKI